MKKLQTAQSVIDLMKQIPDARLQVSFKRSTYKVVDADGICVNYITAEAWHELIELKALVAKEISNRGDWRYGFARTGATP